VWIAALSEDKPRVDHATHKHKVLTFVCYGDVSAANELPTGSFTMVDANASYRFPTAAGSVFVFLRGSNLLDEDARQHASPLKDIAPLPGRSFHVGVRAEF
jgi:iron complex outermembrane receptor protein